MKPFFINLKLFFLGVSTDKRLPERDKKLLIVISLVLLVRIIFIPDWIPYLGILDILFMLGILVDYFFGVIDQRVMLSHYPWGMKSFARLRRIASFLSLFAPNFIKDNLWQYTKDPF